MNRRSHADRNATVEKKTRCSYLQQIRTKHFNSMLAVEERSLSLCYPFTENETFSFTYVLNKRKCVGAALYRKKQE